MKILMNVLKIFQMKQESVRQVVLCHFDLVIFMNLQAISQGHVCTNFIGGFRCDCPTGFKLKENGTCEDIDECTRRVISLQNSLNAHSAKDFSLRKTENFTHFRYFVSTYFPIHYLLSIKAS